MGLINRISELGSTNRPSGERELMTHSIILCQWHNSTSELKMENPSLTIVQKFGSKWLEDVKVRFKYTFGSNLVVCSRFLKLKFIISSKFFYVVSG